MRLPSAFTPTDLRVVLLCWLGYSFAYVGRYDFTASILPMSQALGWSDSTLGGIASCFFLSYAGGQLLSGLLAHFFNPRWTFGCALAGTALCNALVPLFPTPAALRTIWFLNGCAQSLLWCSVVKAMASHVREKAMPFSILIISSTVSVGTLLAYGTAALSAAAGAWRGPFLVAAGGLAFSTALWFALYRFPARGTQDAAPHAAAKAYPRATKWTGDARAPGALPRARVAALVGLVALGCGACGFLRDGLMTWAPKVLHDLFGTSAASSILLALAMPLVGLFAAFLNKVWHDREPNISAMSAACFAVAALFVALALHAMRRPSLALAVAAFAGVTLAMGMVTNQITSMFCLAYRRFFDSALVAGVVDTACYVASSFATYSLGRAADAGGWTLVFRLLALAGAAGLALCAAAARLERAACPRKRPVVESAP